MSYAFLVLSVPLIVAFSKGMEPQCSKFHYEEQLLEKMIRTEVKVEEMKKDSEAIHSRVEEALTDLGRKLERFENRFDELRTDLVLKSDKRTQELQVLKDKIVSSPVAFNVYGIKDLNVQKDETILFSDTIFNIGEAYNSVSGKFTAPVDGIYLFSVYLCTANNRYIHMAIVKDGTILLRGSQHENTNYLCGSATVTAELRSGDSVWVKCTADHSGDNELTDGGHNRNTFSGTLINKL